MPTVAALASDAAKVGRRAEAAAWKFGSGREGGLPLL